MKKFSGLALTVMQNNQQSSVDFTLWMFESRMPFFKEVGGGGVCQRSKGAWAGMMAYTYHPNSQEAETTCHVTMRPSLKTEAGRDDSKSFL